MWQPWASLVAVGAKQWETRSWGTTYRGPLLIHAALRKPPQIDKPLVIEEMIQALGVADFDELPRGVVLAIVDLATADVIVNTTPTREEAGWPPTEYWTSQDLLGDWTVGRYAWHLSNLRRLSVPIKARGGQRLWRPDPVTVAKVEAQGA